MLRRTVFSVAMVVVCSIGSAYADPTIERRYTAGNAGDETRADLQKFEENETALLVEIAEAKRTGDDSAIAIAGQRLAYFYWEAGAYSKAIPLYSQTLEIIKRRSPVNTHDVVACLNNLALNYRAIGRYDESKKLHSEALEAFRGDPQPNMSLMADTYLALGVLALTSYQYAEAERWLGLAKPIVEKFRPQEVAYARLMDTYARLYIEVGRLHEAEWANRRSWSVVGKTIPENSMERMRYLDTKASVYFGLHRFTEAAKAWTDAVDVANRLGFGNSPDMVSVVCHLGELYLYLGDRAKAEPYLQQTLDLMRKYIGPRSPEAAGVSAELALLYTRTGQRERAQENFDAALAVLDTPNTKRPLDLAVLLTYYGEFLAKGGRWEDAYHHFQRALELREVLGDHPLVATSLAVCAGIAKKLKRKDEARRYTARAEEISMKFPDAKLAANTVDLTTLRVGNGSGFTSSR